MAKNNPYLKWYYRIMMLIFLGGALSLPFFLKNNSGEPILSFPGMDNMSSTPFVETETTVYKWKDQNGTWQFGDKPPENAQAEVLTISNHANLMPATPIPKAASSSPSKALNSPQALPTTTSEALTMDKAMNVIEDAHAVRELMESRNNDLKSITGDH